MRWRFDRSRSLALMALALGALAASPCPSARGQEASHPPASNADAETEKRIADLDMAIGRYLEAGRIAEAIPPAREKLDLVVRLRGKEHWQTGDARRDLETFERLVARPRAVQDRFAEARRGTTRGEALYGQGQYAQASELCQKTLAIYREVLGEGHPDIAMSYAWMAGTLETQGKYADAEAMDRRALAIRLKALGEAHPDTANSYDHLALTLMAQGKRADAEAMLRRALAILLKVVGEGHTDTANSYDHLALTLAAQGKQGEAEAMLRHALAIRLKALGEAHPDTATSYNNLAGTLVAQRKQADAEAMLRRALAIRLKALGAEHPDTATSYNNLAATLRDQGKYAEAEAMFRGALAIKRKTLGEGHPDTVNSYNKLAGTLAAQGKYAEAEAMSRRALTICLKSLGEAHPATAASYSNLAETLAAQGKYADAEAMHRRALAICLKALGDAHPQTGGSYNNLGASLQAQGKYADAEAMHRRALAICLKALGDAHPQTGGSYNNLGASLQAQAKYVEAEVMHRRALEIGLKALGEGHPHTAQSYNNLAATLEAQGKYVEAEAMFRRALAIKLKALGEAHPDTATSYNNLAATLLTQGKQAEAEAMLRRALAIKLKALGEAHPDTATSYNNLAAALLARGKQAEAEAMLRHALAIYLKALGEGHPDTANSYNKLARILGAQGKQAEAEAMHRRALAIKLKALGEAHPDTAAGFNDLALTLANQGKQAEAEAEAMLRHALAIRRKALGEGHPDTATSYNNLAFTLAAQGKQAEAEAMLRHALAITLEALGEGHPETATSYNNVAATLAAQGKHAEAEAMHRRALEIGLKALGEAHPHTAQGYSNLALSLELQGKHDEALRTWRLAAASYEQAWLLGLKGLEATLGVRSPFPGLAAALARAGQPREAWSGWERGLARGITDEVTRRAARPLNDDERNREAALLGRGQAIDERINRLLGARALTQDQEKTLEEFRQQASEIRRQLLDLEQQFEASYGALASRPATLEEAQKALPEGTALVGWVDTKTDHWACLLGHSGDPVWVRLAGSDKEGTWTKDEGDLSTSVRVELDPGTTKGKAGPLAASLARLRLDPLKGHLVGVRRLVVVNSPGLAGVPVEVLMAARPDPAWDQITVSYAPSAAMFAYLVGRPIPRDRPATLLAVADPAYPEPKDDAPAPEPPGSGIAVARVRPNGNADLNGLREGDILLSYGGTELKQVGDLKPVADDGGPKAVPVKYWREGITRDVEVAAGPLGIAIDPRPAAVVVRARRESQRILIGMRGGSHARLPGTRREVGAVARLFPGGQATAILGPQACESTVQGLARSGKLKGFRYLHFATHGESDPRFAYRTALILAPDPDSSTDSTAQETDGTITAEQIARTWDLDADLVVLSACESGLGRAVEGEGYLGFAQPLFARGARSLVLSQWKVDDDATALLMARFYRNLLGEREGLKAPMHKAEALGEAKRWLRGAGPSEVGAALAALPRGEVVRREAVKSASSAHPYEDPTYWAGFVLVGAPD